MTNNDLVQNVVDQSDTISDVTRSHLGLSSERAHFRRHDAETATGLASPRRFNAGIQREKIGPRCYVADKRKHRVDGTGCVREHPDPVAGGIDRRARI